MTASIKNSSVFTSNPENMLSPDSQELLKGIIRQVIASANNSILQETQQLLTNILLEVDIDGVNYYLVRSRVMSNGEMNLSPREIAIAKLVAQGLPNKSIASLLAISHWTVATYLRRIFVKLNVTSRTAMITKLLEERLLQKLD